jgi:hypothetical protein
LKRCLPPNSHRISRALHGINSDVVELACVMPMIPSGITMRKRLSIIDVGEIFRCIGLPAMKTGPWGLQNLFPDAHLIVFVNLQDLAHFVPARLLPRRVQLITKSSDHTT